MDDPDGPGADQRRARGSRSASRDRMGNGHEAEVVASDGYQSDAYSTGPYRRYSMARSNSSVFENVEMAQDQVSIEIALLTLFPQAN